MYKVDGLLFISHSIVPRMDTRSLDFLFMELPLLFIDAVKCMTPSIVFMLCMLHKTYQILPPLSTMLSTLAPRSVTSTLQGTDGQGLALTRRSKLLQRTAAGT